MPVEVQGPDGQTYHFPDGTNKEAAVGYFKKKGIGAKAPEPKTPGFFKRLAQGVGVPSSMEEAKGMLPQSKLETFEALTDPAAMIADRAVANIGREGAKAGKEILEAGQNIKAGQPVGQNIGKAGAAGTEFLLKGLFGPVGGGAVYAFGEDVHSGNYTGAAGSTLAVLINGLLLKGARKPAEGVRTNKIAFAADVPESMNAAKDLKAVLPDLDKAATGKAPQTVGELLQTVKQAKNQMNTESGLAMQTLRGKEFVPTGIADSIKSRITSDMTMRPEGRQMQSALMKAAKDFEKPWSYEQLDAARMRAQQRLRAYYKKGTSGQYADTKTDTSVIVDKEIARGVQEIVYPAMDQAAGKPSGYFGNLKRRQGTLIQLEEAVDDQVKSLATRTAKIKGSPRFSSENVSAYGHPASTPGLSIHKLQNVIVRPNPAAAANRAVARSFSGRPIPTAAIWSLPVRELLLLPQQEPEPPQNRQEALTALGR